MNKPYFPKDKAHPAPLRMIVERQVRFEEVDMMGIVWHGRYPGYFEDARVALGDAYGIGYMDFYNNGILAPIKQLHVDHFIPLHFQEQFSIEAVLHWSDAMRINFEFIIRNHKQQVAAGGYTVQMMLDCEQNILLLAPPFYEAFRARWKAGEL